MSRGDRARIMRPMPRKSSSPTISTSTSFFQATSLKAPPTTEEGSECSRTSDYSILWHLPLGSRLCERAYKSAGLSARTASASFRILRMCLVFDSWLSIAKEAEVVSGDEI